MKQTNFPSAGAGTAPKTLFGVYQRVFQKIWQAVRAVMRPVCPLLQARREPAHAALTAALAAEAESADWHTRDVLVGSLGSQAQLADNLRRNYYYVPARVLPEQEVPLPVPKPLRPGGRYPLLRPSAAAGSLPGGRLAFP